MTKFWRQTAVIARRDFIAIVFTPTFLVFLLAPLLMIAFGTLGGMGAARLADGGADRSRIVVIAGAGEATTIRAIDDRLRRIYRTVEQPPPLEVRAPNGDGAAQARALFEATEIEPVAVLYGPLDRPSIVHRTGAQRVAAYLAELAEQATRTPRPEAAAPVSEPSLSEYSRATATDSGREAAGFGVVFVMFFLTLLLAGQAVGMLAEERANKVIEILAASVPLEAVFLGKMLGMFGVALLFVGFWGTLISQGVTLLPDGGAALVTLSPAVGLPTFILLALAYFTLAFLLLGAVFLGVGAQAATMREIQMLSLPITMFQVGMFALASAAASSPGSTLATIAEIFPFSSPFAMAARAATDASLWPHVAALAWQMLWVAITITVSARLFRFGVLKSGGSLFSRLRSRKA
jgi:ABC-2 type transport system permease protein